jgi:hypothetical protein
MTKSPLSLSQARLVCKEFRYLTGRPYHNELPDILKIDCVSVAPYDEVNKHIFITEYKDCSDPDQALKLYEGKLFDVVVISKIVSDKVEYKYQTLHDYLTKSDDDASIKKLDKMLT